MLAEGADQRWVIEVKTSARYLKRALDQLALYSRLADATPWLIVFADIPVASKKSAAQLGIRLTGRQEWQALKELVTGHDPAPSA